MYHLPPAFQAALDGKTQDRQMGNFIQAAWRANWPTVTLAKKTWAFPSLLGLWPLPHFHPFLPGATKKVMYPIENEPPPIALI